MRKVCQLCTAPPKNHQAARPHVFSSFNSRGASDKKCEAQVTDLLPKMPFTFLSAPTPPSSSSLRDSSCPAHRESASRCKGLPTRSCQPLHPVLLILTARNMQNDHLGLLVPSSLSPSPDKQPLGRISGDSFPT